MIMLSEKAKKFFRVAEAVMLSLTIIILVFFIYTARTEGVKCMANPLIYGSKILSEQNKPMEFSCVCQFSNISNYQISVNSTAWALHQMGELKNPINLDAFNFTN